MIQTLEALIRRPFLWFERQRASSQDRIVGSILALPSSTVLVIALSLSPDPAGMGTHRQLGLGQCAILSMTGYPCPMCGMTTTFTHLAHLHLLQGTINQPFGLVLFSLTVFAALLGGAELIRPRQRWRRVLTWIDQRETLIAYALLGGMILGWGYKIVMVKGLLPW